MSITITRPFQLPQHQYALWFDVGRRLGQFAQAIVFVAITDQNNQVYTDELTEGEITIIKELARNRGIWLRFK